MSAVENRRTIECSSTSSAEYLPTVENRALLAHRGNSARECTAPLEDPHAGVLCVHPSTHVRAARFTVVQAFPRRYLGRFGLSGDLALKPIKALPSAIAHCQCAPLTPLGSHPPLS